MTQVPQFPPGSEVALVTERHLAGPPDTRRRFVVARASLHQHVDSVTTDYLIRRCNEYSGTSEFVVGPGELDRLDLPSEPRPDAVADEGPPLEAIAGQLHSAPAGWLGDSGHGGRGPYGAANPPPGATEVGPAERHWLLGKRVWVADPDKADGRMAEGRCVSVDRDDAERGVDYLVELKGGRRCVANEKDITALPDMDPGF